MLLKTGNRRRKLRTMTTSAYFVGFLFDGEPRPDGKRHTPKSARTKRRRRFKVEDRFSGKIQDVLNRVSRLRALIEDRRLGIIPAGQVGRTLAARVADLAGAGDREWSLAYALMSVPAYANLLASVPKRTVIVDGPVAKVASAFDWPPEWPIWYGYDPASLEDRR